MQWTLIYSPLTLEFSSGPFSRQGAKRGLFASRNLNSNLGTNLKIWVPNWWVWCAVDQECLARAKIKRQGDRHRATSILSQFWHPMKQITRTKNTTLVPSWNFSSVSLLLFVSLALLSPSRRRSPSKGRALLLTLLKFLFGAMRDLRWLRSFPFAILEFAQSLYYCFWTHSTGAAFSLTEFCSCVLGWPWTAWPHCLMWIQAQTAVFVWKVPLPIRCRIDRVRPDMPYWT